MNFKKYAVLSMGLWVLGFGVYESQPAIVHADEQTTASKLVKTTLSSGTNIYWYDGSVKLPDVTGDDLTNQVVAHFSEGQSEVGSKNITITVDPAENTNYTFSNELNNDGKITLQGKVIVGDVKVKYVDTDGNEIAASTEASHSSDPAASDYLNYTTKQLNIDGYTFVKMSENSMLANGTLSDTGGTVVYVYKANDTDAATDSGSQNQSSNNSTVTDSVSSNNVTTAESDSTSDAEGNSDSVADNNDQADSQTATTAGNTASDSSNNNEADDSANLLKGNGATSISSNMLQQSGLLTQPSTTSSTSTTKPEASTSKTIGQSGADQGEVPDSNTDYYITLASFSLVSVLGLVGISILKH
ncbi:MucBP domain-containing protein [Companilactobacillus sp. HBUAS59699]|uniref:MucBP domain-containing protein n=1 Tax=Companilactobacillus sp. HBUAS59699 TaxID=3109358 RepID=UPI002FF2D86C